MGLESGFRLSTVSAILGIVGWIIRVMGQAIVGTCRERNRDCRLYILLHIVCWAVEVTLLPDSQSGRILEWILLCGCVLCRSEGYAENN